MRLLSVIESNDEETEDEEGVYYEFMEDEYYFNRNLVSTLKKEMISLARLNSENTCLAHSLSLCSDDINVLLLLISCSCCVSDVNDAECTSHKKSVRLLVGCLGVGMLDEKPSHNHHKRPCRHQSCRITSKTCRPRCR